MRLTEDSRELTSCSLVSNVTILQNYSQVQKDNSREQLWKIVQTTSQVVLENKKLALENSFLIKTKESIKRASLENYQVNSREYMHQVHLSKFSRTRKWLLRIPPDSNTIALENMLGNSREFMFHLALWLSRVSI